MSDQLQRVVKICVADVVMSAVSEIPDQQFIVPKTEWPFLSSGTPEAVVRVHFGPMPEVDLGEKIFESDGVWSLYRSQDQHVVILRAPGPQAPAYGLTIFSDDFSSGHIYFLDAVSDAGTPIYPLAYPVDELLMVNLLARGRGVLLHAFGIRNGNGGTLFAGVSGAGKSTLATIWERQPGVSLLSDDRVVVRRRGDQYWVYGTPWCGDARAASPEGVPLDRIFVIRHADENQAVPLHPLDAASQLLVRSFPTFWDAEGMAFTLNFLSGLTQSVPCYDLGFVPDDSVVDFVQCVT